MVKAFVKNNQKSEAEKQIDLWLRKGHIDGDYADSLLEQVDAIFDNQSLLPISKDYTNAFEHYNYLISVYDREKEFDPIFILTMEMMLCIGR